jgi:hypothetical protein
VAQQGPPPPRPSRRSLPPRRTPWSADTYPWDSGDAESEEYPPWAGPDIAPRWAGEQDGPRARGGRAGTAERPASPPRPQPRHTSPGFRSKFFLARARRTRRYTYIWGGAAVLAIAIIVVVTVLELSGHSAPKPVVPGLVTTYQRGEFKAVPDACQSVSAGTLAAYLPGHRRMVAPEPLNGRAESQCNWTLDTPSAYRLLQVTVQVYPPSALASGNGSATANAKDAYATALANKRRPPKATHLPPATFPVVPRVADSGFAALQVVPSHRATTDVMTVVVRDRNVLVTAVMQGFAGPRTHRRVAVSQLQAGATAAARDILSQLH